MRATAHVRVGAFITFANGSINKNEIIWLVWANAFEGSWKVDADSGVCASAAILAVGAFVNVDAFIEFIVISIPGRCVVDVVVVAVELDGCGVV